MIKTLKNLLFFVCILCLPTLTSAQEVEASEMLIEKILLNEDHCVSSYEEDRIYLIPTNIYPMENGLFLDLNGVETVLLSHLNSDAKGCWIPSTLMYIEPYPKPIICPYCSKGYFVKCTNPECPSKKK